jgi:hypothetical protein
VGGRQIKYQNSSLFIQKSQTSQGIFSNYLSTSHIKERYDVSKGRDNWLNTSISLTAVGVLWRRNRWNKFKYCFAPFVFTTAF